MQLTATLATIRCSQCIVVEVSGHLCDTSATGFGGLFDGFMSQVTLMLSTDINITETTYSCQFQYVFDNQ